jgi:hypothetical protein
MIRGLVGTLHLPAMPGDPGHQGGTFSDVAEAAFRDAEALFRGGVDALLVENFGSAPFIKGTREQRLPAHQVAAMAWIARQVRSRFGRPVGINCLRNDARSAMGIAAASELDFIRVNVHTGAYVTDQGVIEGEAHDTLQYRRMLGAEHVAILADVLVKHASPLSPLDPADATRDTFERGLADAVVVTGRSTGDAAPHERLAAVRAAAGERPVLVGSGLTPDNAEQLAPLAHGAIVGTWFKQDGVVPAPVDSARVDALVQAVQGHFRQG